MLMIEERERVATEGQTAPSEQAPRQAEATLRYRRLLVPLDGSARSEAVLTDALGFARQFGGEIVLASVYPDDGAGWPRRAPYFTGVEAARCYLNEQAAALRARGVSASAVVLHGDPAAQLAAYAAGNGVDLLAMATRGDWGRDLGWHGSVTDALVRAAAVPVLLRLASTAGALASAAAPPAVVPRHVVVPLDGSRLAERSLPVASELAEAGGGGLMLVQAIEEPPAFVTPWSMAQELTKRELRAAHDYLASVRQHYARPGLAVETAVRLGSPAAVIGWVARDAGDVLIAMTSHGRSGARRERLGSVALQVLRGGPGLLLLVPSGAAASVRAAPCADAAARPVAMIALGAH